MIRSWLMPMVLVRVLARDRARVQILVLAVTAAPLKTRAVATTQGLDLVLALLKVLVRV